MKHRRVLALLGINLLTLGSLGLMIELYLRGYHPERFRPRPPIRTYNPQTGWSNNPNLQDVYFGWDYSQEVKTDQLGYRLGVRGSVSPKDRLVLLVGDSYTFGWGVSTSESIASYLDEMLAHYNSKLRVVNLGVSGWGTLAYAEQLETALGHFKDHSIEAVVVLHADNDPVDNVKFALWKSGFFQVAKRDSLIPATEIRVLNFFRHLTVIPRWSRTGKLRGAVTVGGNEIAKFSELDIERELDLAETKKHDDLTKLQLALLKGGVKRIDAVANRVELVPHHLILNHLAADNHYQTAMEKGLVQAPGFGGLLTRPEIEFHGPFHNKHSGGHYTAAYNKKCAEELMALLKPTLEASVTKK